MKTVLLLIGFVLASCHFAEAQQPKRLPRIGFLSPASSVDPAFLEGLQKLGYMPGKNIVIEFRSAQGNSDRLPELAAELVGLQVEIIVTQGTPAAQAAKKMTSTIPIVMATSGDPIGTKLVASLSRPGGNITGLSLLADAVVPKQLELLKEAAPRVSRIAWMASPFHCDRDDASQSIAVDGAGLGPDSRAFRDTRPETFETRLPQRFEIESMRR